MVEEINWDEVENFDDFTPVPNGKYLCEVIEAEIRFTQSGDEMWAVRFEIVDGDYKGRVLFDNIVFSEKAMKRVKMIFSRMGINTTGKSSPTTENIMGKRVYLDVGISSYMKLDEATGKEIEKMKNVIPFAGYHRLDEATSESEKKEKPKEKKKTPEDDLPF